MKPPQFGSSTEVAPLASGSQSSGMQLAIDSTQTQTQTQIQARPRPLQPLVDQLAAAARQDNRAEFDRLFDSCFGRVYAMAWRITRDHAQAEAVTEHILYEAVIART